MVYVQASRSTYDLASADMNYGIDGQTSAFPYAQSQVPSYHSKDS
jgi:hypothetical protein